MIRIRLDDLTLGRVRMATSPSWEAFSSLALTSKYRGEIPFPYTKWAMAARRRVSPALHNELTSAMRTHWVSLSSCLIPSLRGSSPATIEGELTVLRAAGHDRFAQLLSDYWAAAIAPYWPDMRGALEVEILVRGRTLATAGAGMMLQDLEERIRWEHPELSMPYQADLDWAMTDGCLIVVPVLFARGARMLSALHETVAFSYQAEGVAVFHEAAGNTGKPIGDMRPRDRLTAIFGRGRAAVLRGLLSPATTTGLATSIGLAPSTVSQHLAVLCSAGLVRRHRIGSRVLYELDDSGTVLLTQLRG